MFSRHLVMAFALITLASTAQGQLPGGLRRSLEQDKWVAYSPSAGNPAAGEWPSEDEIRADLELLYKFGFRGIVTYTTSGAGGRVPVIAEEVGFQWFILGVFDPRSEAELRQAVSLRRKVDAYCVGNEGLGKRYTLLELEAALEELKEETGKPVATSEELGDYFAQPELCTLGDWVFPNAHPFWAGMKSAESGVSWTVEQFRRLQAAAPSRMIVFKEVGFPTGADLRATEEIQADYYYQLAETPVVFAYFEAFDQLWKGGYRDNVEKHWGLFTAKRQPKLVVKTLQEDRDYVPTSVAQADSLPPVVETPKIVRFSSPASGKDAPCTLTGDGGRIEVSGVGVGLKEKDLHLLLYVNPQHKFLNGWFLQLGENGAKLRPDGSWHGRIQLGSSTYPPNGTEIISIAVIAVSEDRKEQILQKAAQGPSKLRNNLPPVGAGHSDIAQDVHVTVKR